MASNVVKASTVVMVTKIAEGRITEKKNCGVINIVAGDWCSEKKGKRQKVVEKGCKGQTEEIGY